MFTAASPMRIPSSIVANITTPPSTHARGGAAQPSSAAQVDGPSYELDEAVPHHQEVAPCRCKHSGCVKMYCDCFANGKLCTELCSCDNCENTTLVHHHSRKRKLRRDGASLIHDTGCRCTRSKCIKRYCECYKAGIQCTDACTCTGCENGKGSYTSTPAFRECEAHNDVSSLLDTMVVDADFLGRG